MNDNGGIVAFAPVLQQPACCPIKDSGECNAPAQADPLSRLFYRIKREVNRGNVDELERTLAGIDALVRRSGGVSGLILRLRAGAAFGVEFSSPAGSAKRSFGISTA